MNNKIVYSLAASMALTGCGGSSGGASESSKLGSSYSITDYSAIESNSLEGTWVLIANGRESIDHQDFVDSGTFSKKQFLTISSSNNQLFISRCDFGSSHLQLTNNTVVLPLNGERYTVNNNNHISGSFSVTYSEKSYENYSFEMVKVSNDASGLGTASASWSGSSFNTDFEQPITSFCAEKRSRVDSDGYETELALFEINTDNKTIELEKGIEWGEFKEAVFVFGSGESFNVTSYSEQLASVAYNDNNTSFTTTASATSSTKGSVNIKATVQLPAQ